MSDSTEIVAIPVEDGSVPTVVLGPGDGRHPGLFVVPSIFGPAPDLVTRLAELAERARVAIPDPFWRVGGSVVAYDDRDTAFARLAGFDLRRCIADLGAVLDWTRERSNGNVAGLGICFGGPFVLRFAGEGRLQGVVTWHGSRMEQFLDRAGDVTCPLRLHFGEDDPITPPEAIDTIRSAFAHHPDVDIAVHPGCVHGYSHDGDAFDEKAARAGLDAARTLLAELA